MIWISIIIKCLLISTAAFFTLKQWIEYTGVRIGTVPSTGQVLFLICSFLILFFLATIWLVIDLRNW